MAFFPPNNLSKLLPPSTGYPVNLCFSARHLMDLDLASRSDPYLLLSRFVPETNSWIRVGCTETIENNLDPNWETSIRVFYYPPPLLTAPTLPFFPPPASQDIEVLHPAVLNNPPHDVPQTSEDHLRRLSATTIATPRTSIVRLTAPHAQSPTSPTTSLAQPSSASNKPDPTKPVTPASYLDYRVELYDRDHDDLLDTSRHDFLGFTQFNLQTLLSSSDHQICAPLYTSPSTPPSQLPTVALPASIKPCKSGTVRIQAFPLTTPLRYCLCTCRLDQMKAPQSSLQLQFLQIDSLNHPHVISASPIYRSVENPEFPPCRLNLSLLCQDDPDQAFLIRIVSHDDSQSTKVLSETRATLQDILVAHGQPPKWLSMLPHSPSNPSPKAASTNNPSTHNSFGTLIIDECDMDYNFSLHSFLDQNRLNFNVTLAVDFSSSPDPSKIECVHQFTKHRSSTRKDSISLHGATLFQKKKRNLFEDQTHPSQPTDSLESYNNGQKEDDYFIVGQDDHSTAVYKTLQLIAQIFAPLLSPSPNSPFLDASDETEQQPPGIRTVALTGDLETDTMLTPLSFSQSMTHAHSIHDLFYHYHLACQHPRLEPTPNVPFPTIISQISQLCQPPPKFNHKPVASFQKYQCASPLSPNDAQHNQPLQTPLLQYEILLILTPLDSLSTLTPKDKEDMIKAVHNSSTLPLSIIFVLIDQFNEPAGLEFFNPDLQPILLPGSESGAKKLVSKLLRRESSQDWSSDAPDVSHLTRQNVQVVPMYSFPMKDTQSMLNGIGLERSGGDPHQSFHQSIQTSFTASSPTTRRGSFESTTEHGLPNFNLDSAVFTPSIVARNAFQSAIKMNSHQAPHLAPTSTMTKRPHLDLSHNLSDSPQNCNFPPSTPHAPLVSPPNVRSSLTSHQPRDARSPTPKSSSLSTHDTHQSPPTRHPTLPPTINTTQSTPDQPITSTSPTGSGHACKAPPLTTSLPPPSPLGQAPPRPSTTSTLSADQRLRARSACPPPQPQPQPQPQTELPTPKINQQSSTLFDPTTIRLHDSIDATEPTLIDPPKPTPYNFFLPPDHPEQTAPTIAEFSNIPKSPMQRRDRRLSSAAEQQLYDQHQTQQRPRRRSSIARPVHIVDPWDALIQQYSGQIFTQLQAQVLDYAANYRIWAIPDQ